MFKLVSKFLRHLHTQMGFRTMCQVQGKWRESLEAGKPTCTETPKADGGGELLGACRTMSRK